MPGGYTNKPSNENRKAGRPKKGEIVTRPVEVHDFDKIKPEKRKAYAHETISNARNIYRKYEKGYPNPLNVDVKDLTPEARECWKSIFTQRGVDEMELEIQCCHDRCFHDADEIVFGMECFSQYIQDQNYVREFERPDGTMGVMPIIPNQSNLARWLGVSSTLISKAMSSADNYAIQAYKRILGDLLSTGAMAGVYQPASTIFTLKNMCDWADKYEDRTVKKDETFAVAEAQELMERLGYVKAQELPTPPIKEISNGPDIPSAPND